MRLIPHRSSGPAGRGDVEVGVIGTVTLAAGNPLRGALCLMCPEPAGAATVAIVAVISHGLPATADGRVPACVWLCHTTCLPARDREFVAASRDRLKAARRRRTLEER